MKAIVFEEYGPPEVLKLKEVPKPIPKNNEVLIKIFASSVGFGDLMVRDLKNSEFYMPDILKLPVRLFFGYNKPKIKILGAELAGEIESVGKDVKLFKNGDQVYAYLGQSMGANAEYICMPENGTVAIKPSNMSPEEAATIPGMTMMALNILKKANIQPGQKVLVNGASGGIGSAAVQLAKYYGAEVTGVCGTPRMKFVKSLGADKIIDYTKEDFTINGQTYDLIFDILGKSSFSSCKNSLSENGIYLLASFKLKQLFQMLWTSIIGHKRVICAMSGEGSEYLNHIKELVESGKIKTIIDKRFPLERTAEAHNYLEKGLATGKVVITMEHNHKT